MDLGGFFASVWAGLCWLIASVWAWLCWLTATVWAWLCGLQWNQFVPDLIVAVFTGLVVGFFLWRFEQRAESRRQEEADAVWLTRLESIERLLDRPLHIGHRQYLPDGTRVSEVVELSTGVHLVHPEVKKRAPELAMLPLIVDAFELLRLSAEDIERATESKVKRHHSVGRLGLDARNHLEAIRGAIQFLPARPVEWEDLWKRSRLPEELQEVFIADFRFREHAELYRKRIQTARTRALAFRNYRTAAEITELRRLDTPVVTSRLPGAKRRTVRAHNRAMDAARSGAFRHAMKNIEATFTDESEAARWYFRDRRARKDDDVAPSVSDVQDSAHTTDGPEPTAYSAAVGGRDD